MKKIYLLLTSVIMALSMSAQTIHWLTFIDTTNPDVGGIDILGREVLYSHFINEVDAALAPAGYKSSRNDIFGDKMTPENLKATVQNLRCNPEDIIVFYYIGHGGRPNIKDNNYLQQHPYPQLWVAQNDARKAVPLEWVYKQLSSKGARLAVTIGMACNSIHPDMLTIDAPQFSPNYGATYMSGNKIARIQDLFLKHKGSLIATSSSPLETSGCLRSNFGIIDAYTTILCAIFDNVLDNLTTELDWDTLLTVVRESVYEEMKRQLGKEQTPIHDTSNISRVSPPSTPKQNNIPTPPPANTQDDNSEFIEALTVSLDALINKNIDEDERMDMEDEIRPYFTSNAKIKMMSQDGDIVIDREDVDTFLGRLSTSRILLKVVPIEAKMNGHKISELKVKEIYKGA